MFLDFWSDVRWSRHHNSKIYPGLVSKYMVVDNLCFGNIVEVFLNGYDVTDAFSEVADMNLNLPEEIISQPSPKDHDCFWVYSG